MGLAASRSHIKFLDIQTPIFHDTYGDYPKIPDLQNNSSVRDRLYYACTGWIGRNVFFRWKTGHAPTEFTKRNRQLADGRKHDTGIQTTDGFCIFRISSPQRRRGCWIW